MPPDIITFSDIHDGDFIDIDDDDGDDDDKIRVRITSTRSRLIMSYHWLLQESRTNQSEVSFLHF